MAEILGRINIDDADTIGVLCDEDKLHYQACKVLFYSPSSRRLIHATIEAANLNSWLLIESILAQVPATMKTIFSALKQSV